MPSVIFFVAFSLFQVCALPVISNVISPLVLSFNYPFFFERNSFPTNHSTAVNAASVFTQSLQRRKLLRINFFFFYFLRWKTFSEFYWSLSNRMVAFLSASIGKWKIKDSGFFFFFRFWNSWFDSNPKRKSQNTQGGTFNWLPNVGWKIERNPKTRGSITRFYFFVHVDTRKDTDVVDLLMASENFHGSCASILWRCSSTYQVYI